MAKVYSWGRPGPERVRSTFVMRLSCKANALHGSSSAYRDASLPVELGVNVPIPFPDLIAHANAG